MWIVDNGIVVDVNDAALSLLGYAGADQVLRKCFWELAPEYQPNGELSREKGPRMLDIAHSDGIHRFDWMTMDNNGQVLPVEVTLTRIPFWGKDILHCAWRDVSARKEAEEALRSSEEKFRMIAESIQDVFWMSERKSLQMVYVSKAYEQIWGQSRDQVYQEPRLSGLPFIRKTGDGWRKRLLARKEKAGNWSIALSSLMGRFAGFRIAPFLQFGLMDQCNIW